MIRYKDIHPGDTFVRRNAKGVLELRRIMNDGTSEFVRRLEDDPEDVLLEILNLENQPYTNPN